MTRINANLPPKNLTDEHLISEHRELKRVCDFYAKRLKKNKFDDIPKNFTLNAGHVTFFLDKGKFTFFRYLSLYFACHGRKIDVQDYSNNWSVYQDEHFNNWYATDKDNQIIIDRITERIKQSPKKHFHYHKQKISKEEAIELLNK